jgi:hypothetical protein
MRSMTTMLMRAERKAQSKLMLPNMPRSTVQVLSPLCERLI